MKFSLLILLSADTIGYHLFFLLLSLRVILNLAFYLMFIASIDNHKSLHCYLRSYFYLDFLACLPQ